MTPLALAKLERYERLVVLGPPPPLRHIRKLARWLKAYAAIWAVTLDEMTMFLREMYPRERAEVLAMRPMPALAKLSKSDAPLSVAVTKEEL